MRRHAFAFVSLCLLLGGTAAASPKIALVRIGEIYRALPEATALEQSVQNEQAAILKNARADAYRAVLRELDELRKGMAQIPENDRASLDRARRNYLIKRQEAFTLQREFQSFREQRTREINTQRVATMEKILADIRSKAAELGSAKGFDWVLDSEGRTNTGLPFVLYSKEPHDITDDVLDALGGANAKSDPGSN